MAAGFSLGFNFYVAHISVLSLVGVHLPINYISLINHSTSVKAATWTALEFSTTCKFYLLVVGLVFNLLDRLFYNVVALGRYEQGSKAKYYPAYNARKHDTAHSPYDKGAGD